MPRAKESYHHGDLENALVKAAVEAVRTSGAESLSLRDIARSVGVSANATYRHFASKATLLTAVANAASDELAHAMQRKLAQLARHAPEDEVTAAIESVRAVGRAYVAFAFAQPALFRLLHGPDGMCKMTRDPSAAHAPTTEVARLFGGAFERLVHAGVLAPEHRDDGASAVWMAIHGFASLSLDGLYDKGKRRDEALERLLDFTLRGLGVSPLPKKKR